MFAGEREAGSAVVEIRRQPGSRRMAQGAVMIKIAGDMVRILHSFKRALMA